MSPPQESFLLSACDVTDEMGDIPSIPYSISFSKSGTFMSVSSEDGCIRLFDATTDLPVTSLTCSSEWQAHDNAVFATSWIKDDSCLLSCSGDATVNLWDVGSQERLRSFAHHRQSVKLVAPLPSSDGSVFASGSRDGSLALWDIREPGSTPISTVEGAHAQVMVSKRTAKKLTVRSITGAVFLPGTHLLLSSGAGDTTVKTWDIRMMQKDKKKSATSEVASFSCRSGPYGITSLALSPDGSRLLANATDSKLYMMSSIHPSNVPPLAVFTGHHSPPGDHSFYISCGWSSDGSCVAAGSLDNSAYVWSATRPDLTALKLTSDHPAREAFGVCFSPEDPTQVATISDSSTIRMWRLGFPSPACLPPAPTPLSLIIATPESLAPRELAFASSHLLVKSRGQRVVNNFDFEYIPLQPYSKEEDKENVDPSKGLSSNSPGAKLTPAPLTSIHKPLVQLGQQSEITRFFQRASTDAKGDWVME